MHRNSSPLNRKQPYATLHTRLYPLLLGVALVSFLPRALQGQEKEEIAWYISNAGGMALEKAMRALALRNTHALSVEPLSRSSLPAVLLSYAAANYRMELRILYKDGEALRRQYLFYGPGNQIRVVAAFNADFFNPPELTEQDVPEGDLDREAVDLAAASEEKGPDLVGFIEVYNSQGQLEEERIFEPRSYDRIVQYSYRNGVLISAETQVLGALDEEGIPVVTERYADYYRYSRSHSLRSVERQYSAVGEDEPNLEESTLLHFPHTIIGIGDSMDFVSNIATMESDFFRRIPMKEGYSIIYATDERGRILTETLLDESGELLARLENHWNGNRLDAVTWKAGDEERRVEYEYDSAGDRLAEWNYVAGELERVVRTEGNREVEELYMNGQAILRTIWEDGRRVSEERLLPARGALP